MRVSLHRLLLALLFLSLASSSVGAGEVRSLRLASYNVRNYLAMDRLVDGGFRQNYPKPEAEKAVVRKSILTVAPDLIVLQEIGTKEELRELRDDLADEGLNYGHFYLLEAADDARRIGALWRNGLEVAPVPHVDLSFNLFDEERSVRRGMLELKVEAEGGRLFSVFALHLKSKYTSDSRDPQSALRRVKEANAARERILELFPEPAKSPFFVFGDLNDHRNSSAVRRFLVRGDLQISRILEATDKNGLIWTHYYVKGGEYSLIDYMLASSGVDAVFRSESHIASQDDYYTGSDHRLVWTDLTPLARN